VTALRAVWIGESPDRKRVRRVSRRLRIGALVDPCASHRPASPVAPSACLRYPALSALAFRCALPLPLRPTGLELQPEPDLPRSAARPFYARLNQILDQARRNPAR
jgi:hypothetical protein